MKLASRLLVAAAMVAVAGTSLACTKNFPITKMPKGTTINSILNGTPTAQNPYAGFFYGYQQQLLLGNGTTGWAVANPSTGNPLYNDLGLGGGATTGKYTVTAVPDQYMPSFGGDLALFTTIINQQPLQITVGQYSVINGANSYNIDDGAVQHYMTTAGYYIFGLHQCNGSNQATLTINNSHVLAAFSVDNGVVYIVDGIAIPTV